MYNGYYERRANRNKVITALVIFILLLVVSVAALTIYLFVIEPDDGTIGINVTTGQVKVDIVDTKGESIVGEVLDFVLPQGSTEFIFEPGGCYYTEGFKVKNDGNIALRFHIYVSDDEDVDMDEFKDAFELYITKDPTNPESNQEIVSFNDILEVGQLSETYHLVIKMKETAGNKFQNKVYTSIGVTVHATQKNASFEE